MKDREREMLEDYILLCEAEVAMWKRNDGSIFDSEDAWLNEYFTKRIQSIQKEVLEILEKEYPEEKAD